MKATGEQIKEAKGLALGAAAAGLREHVASAILAPAVLAEFERLAAELEAKREKLAVPALAKKELTVSQRGLAFADWFRGTLPEGVQARMVKDWRVNWARCFDLMLVADGRTEAEIARVCQWARAERYWSKNFLSPAKLRQRDRNQVFYFDRFAAEMAERRPGSRAAAGAAGEHYEEAKKALPLL